MFLLIIKYCFINLNGVNINSVRTTFQILGQSCNISWLLDVTNVGLSDHSSWLYFFLLSWVNYDYYTALVRYLVWYYVDYRTHKSKLFHELSPLIHIVRILSTRERVNTTVLFSKNINNEIVCTVQYSTVRMSVCYRNNFCIARRMEEETDIGQ